MKYFADFHIHSHYSRATSKDLNLESLYQWAHIKGINVIGTGDFTHPEWIKELEEKLEPDGNGLFKLKNPPKMEGLDGINTKPIDVRFCLSTEISSIYKYGDKVRKNHNLVLAPDFETAKKINAKLGQIGNLASDGRPILGLPSHDLLEIVLNTSEDAHLIPAHVWTPWFSTLGSKGGYDSIEECFRDLTPHIFALETGLSSDPAMNWMCSSLDKYALVSNSDAHSAPKLGREANIFDTELSYYAMFEALKTKKGFGGTYEFFPQEGKYHLDGHRNCDICLTPEESEKYHNICPVCGKPLTIGVLNRVEALADRKTAEQPADAPDFKYLIPLPEIIGQLEGSSPSSKIVTEKFIKAVSTFGNEYDILHQIPLDEIKAKSTPVFAEAIRRLRAREVSPQSGFDGEYGTISVFKPGEIEKWRGQSELFAMDIPVKKKKIVHKTPIRIEETMTEEIGTTAPNAEQQQAIETRNNAIIVAGPGTGKTSTLIQWIAHQITHEKVEPEKIIAITFTNKAADELKERLSKQIGKTANAVTVGTFHAVAFSFLKELLPNIETIYDQANRENIFRLLFPELDKTAVKKLSNDYEKYFECLAEMDEETQERFNFYNQFLEQNNAVDLSNIVAKTNSLLEASPNEIPMRYNRLAVDEFQDINPVQYRFVKLMSPFSQTFLIGDPNQSIYSFRGADIRLFLKAKTDFHAERIVLQKNYRTPPKILQAADQLICHNGSAMQEIHLVAVKTSDALVKTFEAETDKDEAIYIADQILKYIGGTDSLSKGKRLSDYDYAFSDIAVLYRTHRISREIIRQLKIKGIPVLLSNEDSLFGEPPFNLISNGLQLFQNPKNINALSSVMDFLLSLSEKQKQEILTEYLNDAVSLEQISEQPSWQKWMQLYHKLHPDFTNRPLAETMQALFNFFIPETDTPDEELASKKDTLLQLAEDEKPDLFLQKYVLSPYADTGRLKSGGVHLLTFHTAKGLEFPVVFIAGAEEGITPIDRKDMDLEEERRLFFVAMTRAKDELQIVNCKKRMVYGVEKDTQPSRFLKEFDDFYKENIASQNIKKQKNNNSQLSLF